MVSIARQSVWSAHAIVFFFLLDGVVDSQAAFLHTLAHTLLITGLPVLHVWLISALFTIDAAPLTTRGTKATYSSFVDAM